MEKLIFEGNIAVKAALESPYRKVNKVWISKKRHDKDTNYILALCHKNNVEIIKTSRDIIDNMCCGKTHGGMACEVEPRIFQTIDDCLNDNFIALVEGIEDPFNYGHVIRSLYAAGCSTLICNKRNWESASNIVSKASAGASEKIKMIVLDDISEGLKKLKNNFKIVCANRNDQAVIMYDYDYTQNICICIGGEKRGLSKEVALLSDQDVYIPYNQEFRNALSATSATTILAFEVLRQRQNKNRD